MYSFCISLRTEKKLSKFIKLNLFVLIRDGGKWEPFAFRFVQKNCKHNWRKSTLKAKCAFV
jgi:hypothetical protein